MQRSRILPKLVIFCAFAEFGQIDMLERANGESELLGREGTCTREDEGLAGRNGMIINLARSVLPDEDIQPTVPHQSSLLYISQQIPMLCPRHSCLILKLG